MPRTTTKTTKQRGYDNRHKRRRELLLRRHVDGTPCDECRQPMYRDQDLDADHSIPVSVDPNSRADRLLHAACNRRRGARLYDPDLEMHPLKTTQEW